MSIEDKLEGPALGIACMGWLLTGLKLLNKDIFPPITHHIGNFNLTWVPIASSGLIGGGIERIGKKYDLDFLMKIGRYLPEIVASGFSIYSVLGEMYNIIPNNTKDPWDIPAALIGAGSGYVIANLFRKSLNP